MMTLPEKGLLDLLRRECWVNQKVPSSVNELSLYLGIQPDVIQSNLTMRVLSFFTEKHQHLICPELDAYKEILNEKREKMVKGGSNGGKKTQSKNRSIKASIEGSIEPLSREELSGVEKSKSKSLGQSISAEEMNEWVHDYNSSPHSSSHYRLASKGGY
jgi:hypothetical protein